MQAQPKAASDLFQLSLRIRHPSIDPAEISRELGLEADHSFRAGEPRRPASTLGSAAVHTQSYWLARMDPSMWPGDPDILPAAIQGALLVSGREQLWIGTPEVALTMCSAILVRNHAAFVRRIQSEGGDVSLLLELSPDIRGFTLTPAVSRALSELGIAIDFEIS
jgi:hypothetical protein